MANYRVTRVEGPVPADAAGYQAKTFIVENKDTGIKTSVFVEVPDADVNDPTAYTAILTAAGYVPNDWT